MAALLRKVDSIPFKELGKQTGRRSSLMEQTLQPKLVPGKRWGAKTIILFLETHSYREDSFAASISEIINLMILGCCSVHSPNSLKFW